MASIPLPALGIKPVEQPDMFGNLAKALSVKNLQQESQRSAIETQQAQQGQADQQAFRAAMTDPSMKGKTIGEIADALASSGHISQASWVAAKKADVDQRKSFAELDEKTLANRAASHTQTQQLYNAVMNMPDDQLSQNWAGIAQQYDSIPGNKPILDPAKPLSKAEIAQMGPMLDMHEAYLASELAKRKAANEAKASGYKGEGGVLYDVTGDKPTAAAGNPPVAQQELSAWLNTKDANGKTRAENGETAVDYQQASETKTENTSSDLFGTNTTHRTAPNLAAPSGSAPAAPAKTAIVPPAKPNATAPPKNISSTPVDVDPSGRNDAALQGLKPSEAAVIKSLADYRMNPQLYVRRPGVMAKVAEYDPTFDQQRYQIKQKTRQYFITGKGADEVQAFNTAQQHADLLQKSFDALNNSDMPSLNAVKNSFASAFGSGAPVSTKAIIDAYNHEVNTAIAKGHTTDHEIADRKLTLSPNASPEQVKDVLDGYKSLMQSKIRIRMNQYEAGLRGEPSFGQAAPGQQQPNAPQAGGAFNWDAHPVVK